MMMKKWDNIDYQKMKAASFDGTTLSVHFQNDDQVELSIEALLPFGVDSSEVVEVSSGDYDLRIIYRSGEIEVPWDRIRTISDSEFAKDMAKKAEEHAMLVGTRLKALRERKSIRANELADRAGVTPQTISRIEKGHTDVNFATLRKLLAAMGYNLKDLANQEAPVRSEVPARTWQQLSKKLLKAGLDTSLISKIIPSSLKEKLSSVDGVLPQLVQGEISLYFSRVFGWDSDNLWNSMDLAVTESPVRLAYFKTPSKGNINQIKAYSHYAYYLAQLVNNLNVQPAKFEYPGSLPEFKKFFYEHYGSLNLKNLINFSWDLGVGVIPLNDQGVFHGASWNISDKHIVVLKQKNTSHARWIFDLLHELYHVFAHLDESNTSVIELEEVNPFGNSDTPEELEANAFANQFIFGDKAEEVAMASLERANYHLEYLKSAVRKTAEAEHIEPAFLANYLAFRLQANGNNWWGTANSFQTTDPNPFHIASEILQERIEVQNLNPIDRNLLNTAINN